MKSATLKDVMIAYKKSNKSWQQFCQDMSELAKAQKGLKVRK